MEFLTWWFDNHWIISFLFSPGLSIAWHYYFGHTVIMLGLGALIVLNICLSTLARTVK